MELRKREIVGIWVGMEFERGLNRDMFLLGGEGGKGVEFRFLRKGKGVYCCWIWGGGELGWGVVLGVYLCFFF